ncbi:UNVERIFIED_CONTAM: hypothetical protein Slati_4143000 [Sesamum latifolium]|uniref:Early response to dehydration 15-like protein n=1 Tax=Sesamum latifolium TaxID=2727402 RepID=A0AAW2TBY1_9LAMI
MATSALNPNAPIFVPSAYLAVEDFSDEWWDLVQSSPWFRDYWLRECFSDFTGDDVVTEKAITDAVAKGKRIASRSSLRVDSLADSKLTILLWCRERGEYGFGGAGVVEVEEAARRGGDAEVLREGAEDCEHEGEP